MTTYTFNLKTSKSNNTTTVGPTSGVISTCTNGCPNNLYAANPNVAIPAESYNMLYSIYQSYQSTANVQYLSNSYQYLINPENYLDYPPGPANIFIIRHGVPLNDNYYLNCNGIYRACKIPNFINKLATSGYPIFSIVSCYPDQNLDMHPIQTVTAASFLLNIPLFTFSIYNVTQPYNSTTAQTILEIFTNPLFIGKNILICWEHTNIQGLCNQIVQCQQYLANGHTRSDLKNHYSDVLLTSTEDWWKANTPIPSNMQFKYTDVKPKIPPPPYPLPYCDPNQNIDYSKYLPYWNTNDYDTVFKFTQSKNYNLSFSVSLDNIYTCNPNCNLYIGLLQYNNMNDYEGASDCETPKT